ncbi:uncharacterized protein LOC116427812 isoform X2 [Nomia melanderi]|uniref:uncharacterized protein LOC116427812 isoform X2 n=1 Tax=Nomia melanderi TaxID=2448451 RepID=UPI003FCE6D8D
MIVGINHDVPVMIPIEVLNKREKFWNDLFEKYTEEFSDKTELNILNLKLCAPINKAPSFVQYWVDTGRIPYKTSMDLNKQSEHCTGDETSNEYFPKLTCGENGSSSSVDTAAYILSNMNTTNKANTLAIVEGSRQNVSSDVQNTSLHNVETSKHSNNEICEANDKSPVRCTSETNHQTPSSIYSYETEKIVIDKEDTILDKNATTQVQQSSCRDLNRATMNRGSQLFSEKLMHIISNNKIRRTESENSEETVLMENNYPFQDSSTKLSQRKKLYTGRDSPVDIARMSNLGKNRLSLTKFSHPALESGCRIKKRYKIYNKRRTRLINLFRSKETLSTISILTKSKKNSSVDANSTLIKCSNQNVNKSTDSIISNGRILNNSMKDAMEFKKPITTWGKLKNSVVASSRQTEESIISKCKKSTKKISPQNLNPVIRLKRLSEFEIWKYSRSNDIVIDLKSLDPVIGLKRLSESNIQKYQKSRESSKNLKNLEPVVNFKQVSRFNTKEHTEVNRISTISCNLNPIVRLTRLSDTDIKVNVNLNKSNSNTEKSSETIQTQDNDLKPTQLLQGDSITRFHKSKTINLSEDTDSNQSTLLIYQCENNVPCSSSTSNLTDVIDVSLRKNLKMVENDVYKNKSLNSLNNTVDKSNENCIQKTEEAPKSKETKSNKNGYSLRVNKINKTNNSNIYSKQNMDTISNVCIDSCKRIKNALRSKKVKPVNKNSPDKSPDKNDDKREKRQSDDFLLSDEENGFVKLIPRNINKTLDNSINTDSSYSSFVDNKANKRVLGLYELSDEENGFVKLIPQNINESLDNTTDMDLNDISVLDNDVNKRVLGLQSPLFSQPNVTSTFRKPNLRTSRKRNSLHTMIYKTRRTRSTLFQNKEKTSSVDTSKTQTVIKNQMEVYTHSASSKRSRRKVNENSLHYLLDSDSDISLERPRKKNSLRTTIYETRKTGSTLFTNKEKNSSVEKSKTQTVIKNQMEVYTHSANNKRTRGKLNENRLYFQTKLLDSDSEVSVY